MVIVTPAHSQQVSNHYHLAYPAHQPREGDPHYLAFNVFRRANVATAVCYVGRRVGFDECRDAQGAPVDPQPNGGHGLELHHHFLEFAVINAVDLAAIEVDFPNLTNADKVADWAETDPNFMWLCAKHHRSMTGAHHAAFADFEASLYVQNLLATDDPSAVPPAQAEPATGEGTPSPAPADPGYDAEGQRI